MATEHRDLTGSALHEPKGVDTAASNTVYVADGSGSGSWSNIISPIKNANYMSLNCRIDSMATAASSFVVSPLAGKVVAIYVVLHGSISGTANTLTPKIGGVAMTSGNITTTTAGSAAGTVYSSSPSGLNTVIAGQAIEINNNGLATGAVAATVTFLVNTA